MEQCQAWAVVAVVLCTGCSANVAPLRVCADPNNLPFSNQQGAGFENRIAELVARDLQRPLQYVWWAQRRGYVRNTLGAGECDVIPGIATGIERLATTRPYYRSSYVFVAPQGSRLRTFDDPELRHLRIGVQLVGDDYANTPPAHALARRGITQVRGYRVAGHYDTPNPPARAVDAVAAGEVDAAVVWGPLAGYFAARHQPRLAVLPIEAGALDRGLPLGFDIAMGVRRADTKLLQSLNAVLERRQPEIAAILSTYGVPVSTHP